MAVTSVSATTSATTLSAKSSKPRSVYYDGAAILYLLADDGTPSSTNYSAKLGDGYLTYWETPAGYRGAVKGIWSAATGSALVTVFA